MAEDELELWVCGSCNGYYDANHDGTWAGVRRKRPVGDCVCSGKPRPGSHPVEGPLVSRF